MCNRRLGKVVSASLGSARTWGQEILSKEKQFAILHSSLSSGHSALPVLHSSRQTVFILVKVEDHEEAWLDLS